MNRSSEKVFLGIYHLSDVCDILKNNNKKPIKSPTVLSGFFVEQ